MRFLGPLFFSFFAVFMDARGADPVAAVIQGGDGAGGQALAAPSNPASASQNNMQEETGESSVSQPILNPNSEANPAESLLKMRDPFKRPDTVIEDSGPRSDLETYASHQFQLIGVITGPREIRAIIQSPSGKTFFVKRGDHIGQRKGMIDKITPERMMVQEKIVNVLGQAENIITEIKINIGTKMGISLPASSSTTGNPPRK